MKTNQIVFFVLFFFSFFYGYEGLEYYGRQKINPNTDFLAHESAGVTSAPKRDYVASDFPALPKPSTKSNVLPSLTTASAVTTNNNKNNLRDYVAPQKPNNQMGSWGKPLPVATSTTTLPSSPYVGTNKNIGSSGGKRDYVVPQKLNTQMGSSGKTQTVATSTTILPSTPNVGTNNNPGSSGGKRDYVAPRPANTPQTQQGGKVKDLVNFYDNKAQVPENKPTYSFILKDKVDTKPTTLVTQPMVSSTTKLPGAPSTKPSFSSILSGSNKPESPIANTVTKQGQTTPSQKPTIGITPKPNSQLLPSTIVNNNKKDQNSNGKNPTDNEIQSLSEELLRKDVNNAAKLITVNYQGKTTSWSKDDNAPLPLLTIPESVWNLPTVKKFVPLLDNYERDTLVNEYVTPQERNEENSFMDEIMSTTVIRHLMTFLKEKGYVTPDPRQQRDFLKQLWFSLYSRGKGKISSSGFEHVFASESRGAEVLGLHNWIYFAKEEAANRANYLGYMKYVTLGEKGAVTKIHFTEQGNDKPVNSMFVGTSPELEIALYTLCFVTRADNDCPLKLGGKDVIIKTHTFRYRSKNLIGSAFPSI